MAPGGRMPTRCEHGRGRGSKRKIEVVSDSVGVLPPRCTGSVVFCILRTHSLHRLPSFFLFPGLQPHSRAQSDKQEGQRVRVRQRNSDIGTPSTPPSLPFPLSNSPLLCFYVVSPPTATHTRAVPQAPHKSENPPAPSLPLPLPPFQPSPPGCPAHRSLISPVASIPLSISLLTSSTGSLHPLPQSPPPRSFSVHFAGA